MEDLRQGIPLADDMGGPARRIAETGQGDSLAGIDPVGVADLGVEHFDLPADRGRFRGMPAELSPDDPR